MSDEPTVVLAESQLAEVSKENDKLRGLLAWGNDPCVYCTLPRAEMQRCRSGFPGCARGDDMMAMPDLKDWTTKRGSAGA